MRLFRTLAIFAILLAVATANAFLGYHYLTLAGEYRARNLTHLNDTSFALLSLSESDALTPSTLNQIERLVLDAQSQAVWCVDNLSRFERAVMERAGGKAALDICEKDIVTADGILALLSGFKNAEAEYVVPPGKENQLRASLQSGIQRMNEESLAFQPYVGVVERQLVRFVQMGSLISCAFLASLFTVVSARLTHAFKVEREQAIELRVANERIRQKSLTDPLTGLPNRRDLDRHLRALDPTERTMLIRVDLDRFKQVNDLLGHAAGDHVLCHVARVLLQTTRPGDLSARVGGDEFVVLCQPGTTLKEAEGIAMRLLQEVTKPLMFGKKRCHYGASFGVAESIPDRLEATDLLGAADTALYEAKRTGRGRVQLYTPQMHDRSQSEKALAERFVRALEDGEIVPYYQTQHKAADWSIAGVEVLARWEHPSEGLILPEAFLDIARQLGQEADVDAEIFARAIQQVAALRSLDLDLPRVAFNVSAARIMDPQFVPSMQDWISDDRTRYVIEILESISYEDSQPHLEFAIDALKDLGFEIEVDDFGSGHASINSVLKLEPHALKIDREIVRRLGENHRSEMMVASIVQFARSLGIKVIAEGVDSEHKAMILRRMGCDLLQGFFFSMPMSHVELQAFLVESAARHHGVASSSSAS